MMVAFYSRGDKIGKKKGDLRPEGVTMIRILLMQSAALLGAY
jgi:hypothetical protein